MNEIFKQFVNSRCKPLFNSLLSKERGIGKALLLANILLVFFLILLNNLGVLPIKNLGNFIFFAFLLLLLALYRPGWSFLFFVGTIALENINVAPAEIGINVRPYQLFAALTIIAVLVRFLVKRLNFDFPKWKWVDLTLIIFAIAGFISVVFSVDKVLSFKQSVIAASFVAIYFLVRVFIQNLDDLKKVLPFLSSSVIIVFYGIWQNWRFTRGLSSFEAMPGRPNATLTEPDWLGIYLVLLIAVIYALLYYFQKSGNNQQLPISNFQLPISNKFLISKFSNLFLYLLLTSYFLLLILTVSRSAWLGGGIVTAVFLLAFLIKKQWKQFLNVLLFIAVAIISSTLLIYIFSLTNFQLFNRMQSTGTGLQKITISCDLEVRLPSEIESIDELSKYNCLHINLEEIATEEAKGKYVTEIYRTDPNVNIRQEIYQKSWEQIKKHPLFGIGWGNIGLILGRDERGAVLNSSNIFLETWLGGGILGLVALILVWVYIFIRSIKLFSSDNLGGKSLGLLLLLGAISLLIPNLFNAGIFMGILWLFFGISNINNK